MKIKLSLAAALAIASISHAQAVEQTCEQGTVNCNYTDLGDKDQSADNSVSEAVQNNPSSNSNQSGNTIAPDNRDVNHNSNDGSITGGNTSSHGGSAIGNKSDNANNSHASNGNQSSSNAQGQGQASYNDLANKNQTSNDVSNKLGQGQTSDNANSNKLGQSLDSNNNLTGGNQGQSSANSNKVAGSKQGQSSSNDLSTSDNRKQSSNQALSNSGNSASGSNSSNSMGKSGNSQTSVDASDRSVSNYSSQTLVKAPYIPVNPITIAGSTANTIVMQCAAIPHKSTTAVNGFSIGLLRNTSVPLGYTQQINTNYGHAPFIYYTAPDGTIYEMGEQQVITTSVNNTGSSRSVSLDVSEALGKGGSGGASNSSAMQTQVTTIQGVPCVHATYEPKLEVVPAPRPVQQIRYDEPETQDFSYLTHGQKG